jgi:hypothetical protein
MLKNVEKYTNKDYNVIDDSGVCKYYFYRKKIWNLHMLLNENIKKRKM